MKWSVVVGFLVVCLARYNEGGALKCTPGSEDPSCTTEKEGKATLVQISKKDQPSGAAEVKTEAECLAGSEWDSNCHYCRCSESGIAECSKLAKCDTGSYAEPIKCKPSTSFKRDCNTCMCLENGLGLCTPDICQTSPIPKKSELKFGQECSPGSTWKSQCNQCRCSPNGYPVCTEIGCVDYESDGSPMRCAPSTIWKRECNTCWCTTKGSAMCTRMECVNFETEPVEKSGEQDVRPNISVSRKVRALPSAQEPPKLCKPDQEFRIDCNKCLCNSDGQDYSCTRIDCIAFNNNNNGGSRSKREILRKCQPSSEFYKDCNLCICSEDGESASCTAKSCAPTKKAEDHATGRYGSSI